MSRLRAARAGAWSVGLQLIRLGVQAGVFFLFARHLPLEVIGAYGFAYAFVQLTQAFVRTGVLEVYVANERSDDQFAATAFWTSSIIGMLSAGAVFAAGLIALALETSGAYMFFLLGVIPLIDALGVSPEAMLRKELKFASITLRTTVGLFIAALLCLALSYLGWGIDALISFNLSASAISTIVSLWIVRGQLRLVGCTWADVRGMLRTSLNVSLSTFATGVVVPASQIALGAAAGPAAVGAFTIAHRFLGLINSVLVEPVKMAALPVLSKVRGEDERRQAMLEVVGICAALIIPVCFSLAVIGLELLPLMLGDNGAVAAPIFAILALHCVPLIISKASAQMLLLAGRSRDILVYTGLLSAAGIATAAACASFGAEVTAFGYVARAYALSPIALYQLFKAGGVPPTRVLRVILMPVLPSAIMAGAVHWLLTASQASTYVETLVTIGVAGAVGGLIYVSTLYFVARPQLTAVFRLVRSLGPARTI